MTNANTTNTIHSIPWRREPLNALTTQQRDLLLPLSSTISLKKGQNAYNTGDRPDHIFYTLDGFLKSSIPSTADRLQITKISGPGDINGLRALLANQPHQTTLTALQAATLLAFPRRAFFPIIQQNPRLALLFAQSLAEELRQARLRETALTTKQTRGRLAYTLLYLIQKFGTNPATRQLNISLTRQELAQLSNMTTANAIRTLAAFNAENTVLIQKHDIIILDQQTLQKISQHE